LAGLVQPPARFVGLDLAWGRRARTGAAVLDERGRLLDVVSLLTDDELVQWVEPHAPRVVAVDAPLVVENATGMRECERLVGRAYGRYGASCHVSNSTRMPAPRGALLAHGRWRVDASAGAPGPVCVEVYPHAALVGLFALPYRLAYKKGRLEDRRRGFHELVRLLEGWPVLQLTSCPEWAALRAGVASAVRQVELNRLEDQLDAVLCAGMALLHHRGELHVYGDALGAHVVAPAAPSHPPVRPWVLEPTAAGGTTAG
jgi:predicted RNase H-like nuclease